MVYSIDKVKSGTKVIAKIKGILIEDACIHNDNRDNRFYICHNNSDCIGSESPDKHDYYYSWVFYKLGEFELSDDVEIIAIYDMPLKEEFEISERLSNFLKAVSLPTHALNYKHIVSEYKGFDVSENKGLVKLTNLKNKQVEIKFGRFVNNFLNQLKGSIYEVKFDNSKVEKLHNNYLSLQNGEDMKIEIISGEDILYAYKRSNYHVVTNCNLAGSCMSDKLSFLKIYTQNTEAVKMVCIKTFDKVIGRALLWKTECGKQILDKQYVSFDWVYNKFAEIAEQNGYIIQSSINENDSYKVNVDLTGIEEFPYLDTFMYCKYKEDNLKDCYLSTTKIKDGCLYLRSTTGSYDTYR